MGPLFNTLAGKTLSPLLDLNIHINVNNGNTVTKYCNEHSPFSGEGETARKPVTISSDAQHRQIPPRSNEIALSSQLENTPLPFLIQFKQPAVRDKNLLHALSVAEKHNGSLQKERNHLLSSANRDGKEIKRRITKLEGYIAKLEQKISTQPDASRLHQRLGALKARLLIGKYLETQEAMTFWSDWTPEMRAEYMEGLNGLQPSELDIEAKRDEVRNAAHQNIEGLLSSDVMKQKQKSIHRIQEFLKKIDIRAQEMKKIKDRLFQNEALIKNLQMHLSESHSERAEKLQQEATEKTHH